MASALYLLPLLIYFPRFVPGVETQPLLMVLWSFWFLASSPAGRSRFFLTLLTGLLLLCAFLRIGAGSSLGSSLSLLQLLIGPLAFFGAAAANAPPPSRTSLMVVTVLLLCFALLEIAAPGAYGALAGMMLDRVTVADGHRGVSFFTPEPTYAAISLIYLVLLTFWARQYGDRRHAWIEWVQVLLLTMTLSTYAVLFAVVLAIARWPRTCAAVLAALVLVVPTLGSAALDNDESIRAVVAISRILASDFSTFLPSLSLVDPSLGSRILTNTASFQTPTFSFLGLGFECNAVPTAFEALGYDFAFTNEVLAEVMEAGCLKPQAYGAAATLGLGLLALPYAVFLVIAMRHSLSARQRTRLWRPALAIALLLLFMQAQLSSPIPWMLLFLAMARFHPQPAYAMRLRLRAGLDAMAWRKSPMR